MADDFDPLSSVVIKSSTSIIVQVVHVQLPWQVTLHIDGKSIVYPPLINHTPLSCVAPPTLKLLPVSSTAFPFLLHEVGAIQTFSIESVQTITSSFGNVNCMAAPLTTEVKVVIMHRILIKAVNNCIFF